MTRLVVRAALFALSLTLFGCQTRTPPAPATPAKAEASVKAGELLQAYGTNAVAADVKFKGKVIQVTGKFNSAQKAPFVGYVVQLLPEDAADANVSFVQCVIVQAAEADVANFKEGQMITMQGQCDGQVLGQVKLSKCTVVK